MILFYKFTHIADPAALAAAHKQKAAELGLKGRAIIAEEGINATFEGTREAVRAYVDFLHADPRFADVLVKESAGTRDGKAFPKLSVKVRDEVVTLGAGRFDIARETAAELPAAELQKWYDNGEDFVVLDLRNDYEIASGKFDRTIDFGLTNFRELPEKIAEMEKDPARAAELAALKRKKIVPVCTGGIRCEKATCFLKQAGFENMYQLKDGIHTYMKEFPGEHFKGTLFVFDNRLTTDVVPPRELPPEKKVVIGSCVFCSRSTEQYACDDSVRPSRKILCCEDCFEEHRHELRESVSVTIA